MSDAKIANLLHLYKNGILAGTLERTEQGSRLVFDKKYRNSATRSDFCYQISLDQGEYRFPGVGLPPYFAGLLPEGLRLRALVRRLKTSEDDLFSLLAATGDDPVGDIHFKDSLDSATMKIPADFSALHSKLKKGEDPGHNSLAGVQEKISADRISLPISIKKKNKSYILKLASAEFPDIVANEDACLKIAKACGLQVNSAKIVKDDKGDSALLVERFDRQWDVKNKQWQRFHQEDACQFLNRYPADKYRMSLQEIADGIAKFSSSPEIEILNLLKLKAFSYLIGNGDLHAKNISLLQHGDLIQLSPCYDIICTAIYGDLKMALLLDGKNENLKRKNFMDFAARYGVPAEATASMLQDVTAKFVKNKDKIFAVPAAHEKEKFLSQLFAKRIAHLTKK